MDIEAIARKYAGDIRLFGDVMRAALTELAAGYEERIRQMEAERVAEGWIPVSDRLPDSGVSFLAVTDCAGDIHISTMRLPVLIAKNEKQSGEFIRERVTHWMPLPEAPQPKKEPRHE